MKMLKVLLLVLLASHVFAQTTVDIKGLSLGDSFRYKFAQNSNEQYRYPDIPKNILSNSFKLKINQDGKYCLLGAQNFKTLGYFKTMLRNDGYLIKFDNNTVSLVIVDPISSNSWIQANTSANLVNKRILFGRIYSSDYEAGLAYRVYYRAEGADSKIMYYDSKTGKNVESAWQPLFVSDKAAVREVKGTKEDYYAVINTGDSSFTADKHLKVLKLINTPQKDLAEDVFDLLAGLNNANFTANFQFSYITTLEYMIPTGSNMLDAKTLVFGGMNTVQTSEVILYSCLVDVGGYVSSCISLYSKASSETNKFLRFDTPKLTGTNTISARALFVNSVDSLYTLKQEFVSFDVAVESVNSKPVLKRENRTASATTEYYTSSIPNSYLIEELGQDVLLFKNASTKAMVYALVLESNSLRLPEPTLAAIPLNDEDYCTMVQAQSKENTRDFALYVKNGCWRNIQLSPGYSVELDSSQTEKPNFSIYYDMPPKNPGDKVTSAAETVNLVSEWTGIKPATPNLNLRERIWGDSAYVRVPAISVKGPITSVTLKKGNTTANATNIHKIRYYYADLTGTNVPSEIVSGRGIGTLDRFINLENGDAYYNCINDETVTSRAVTCSLKKNFGIVTGTSHPVAIHTWNHMTAVVVTMQANPKKFKLLVFALNDDGSNSFQVDIPDGSTKHAVAIVEQVVFVMFVDANGELGARTVDLRRSPQVEPLGVFWLAKRNVESIKLNLGYGIPRMLVVFDTGYSNYMLIPGWLSKKESVSIKSESSEEHLTSLSKIINGCAFTSDLESAVFTDGNKLFWTRAKEPSGASRVSTFGLDLKLPGSIEDIVCSSDRSALILSGDIIVKLEADQMYYDLAANRFNNRRAYTVDNLEDVKILFHHKNEDYFYSVRKNVTGSVSHIASNGFTFSTSVKPDGTWSVLYGSEDSNVTQPATVNFEKNLEEKYVNCSSFSQISTQDNKTNFTIMFNSSTAASFTHLWNISVTNKDTVKVTNRFSNVDKTKFEKFNALDVAYFAPYYGYITLTTKPDGAKVYQLSVTSEDYTATTDLLDASKIQGVPILGSFSVFIEKNYSIGETYELKVPKAVVISKDGWNRFEAVSYTFYSNNTMRTVLNPPQDYASLDKVRSASINNNTFFAYTNKYTQGVTAWTDGYGAINASSFSTISDVQIRAFDLFSYNNSVYFVGRTLNDSKVQIARIDTNDKTWIWTKTEIELGDDGDLTRDGLFCSAYAEGQFGCVFYGVKTVHKTFEAYRGSMAKLVDTWEYASYRNLKVTNGVILKSNATIMMTKQISELDDPSSDENQAVLYYPLANNKSLKAVFISGALSKSDIIKLQLGDASKIVEGPSNLVMIGQASRGFQTLKLATPKIIGFDLDRNTLENSKITFKGSSLGTITMLKLLRDSGAQIPDKEEPKKPKKEVPLWLMLLVGGVALVLIIIGVIAVFYARGKNNETGLEGYKESDITGKSLLDQTGGLGMGHGSGTY